MSMAFRSADIASACEIIEILWQSVYKDQKKERTKKEEKEGMYRIQILGSGRRPTLPNSIWNLARLYPARTRFSTLKRNTRKWRGQLWSWGGGMMFMTSLNYVLVWLCTDKNDEELSEWKSEILQIKLFWVSWKC